MRPAGFLYVVIILSCAVAPAADPTAEWHVAPTGDDANPGTKEAPFATLERARSVARDHDRSADDAQPATIWLASGIHQRTKPFVLGSRDTKLVIRGPADRSARIHAGRIVDHSLLRKPSAPLLDRLTAAAREQVLAIDLAAIGLAELPTLPEIFNDGGGLPDLTVDDMPLPLSRWPNEGPTTIEKVIDRGEGVGGTRRGGVFIAGDDRVGRWPVAEGVWLEGYWRVPWDPATIRVAAIDPATRRIDLTAAVQGGIGSKYAPKGELGDGKEPWWAVNLPEEIDLPGEWCIHFPTKTLLLLPPPGFGPQSVVRLAVQREPLVVIEESSMVALQSLTLEGGLGDGVAITGGCKALVLGCLIRNLGGNGVTAIGGTRHAIRGCDMHSLGEAGVILAGGDRATLAPCAHAALNNDIHHVGMRRKTWAAAIHVGRTSKESRPIDAVGCRVAHNFLHDLPHSAVLYTGNENIFEANEVCRVALTSGDVGAFYTSHDWTSHGNVLRHNFVHDCPRANAFYLDDGDSGDTVEENVIVRAACGPFIGGGHDNIVQHNLIVECPIGIHIDSRGVSRGYATNKNLRNRLAETPIESEVWRKKYPAIPALLDSKHDAGVPHGNVIVGNVTVRCGTPYRKSGKPAELVGVKEGLNLDLGTGSGANDPAFANPGQLDYAIEPTSPIFRRLKDFPQIPFASIGLRMDAYRAVLADPSVRVRASDGVSGGVEAISSQIDIDTTNQQSERGVNGS
ncbi:MAG: hypothetical protein WCR51_02035 [Planctomycetia bacterium]